MHGELPELQRARLKIKAMRSFVRDLDITLAQAEEALERNRSCTCKANPTHSPLEAQSDRNDRPRIAA